MKEREPFDAAAAKLEDARGTLRNLRKAGNAQDIRREFNAMLSHLRSVTYALQKHGARIPGFEEWYGPKQTEMRQDALLRFVHLARRQDIHEGKHRLQYYSDAQYLEGTQHVHMPEDEEFESFRLGFSSHEGGAYVVLDPGTPRERRRPVELQGDIKPLRVTITDAPTTHLGQPLKKADPVTVGELSVHYLEQLLFEAKSRFAATR